MKASNSSMGIPGSKPIFIGYLFIILTISTYSVDLNKYIYSRYSNYSSDLNKYLYIICRVIPGVAAYKLC